MGLAHGVSSTLHLTVRSCRCAQSFRFDTYPFKQLRHEGETQNV
jgi:hypothetical protein